MCDIVIDPRLFIQSKLHTTILTKIRKILMRRGVKKPRAKNKWIETVAMDNVILGVTMHRIVLGDQKKVNVMKYIRKQQKSKRKWGPLKQLPH